MERKISGNLRNGSSAAANQGVRFPYGFPGSLNPYHISLPPRSTTVPNSKPAANEFRTKIKDEVYETQGPETLENEIKAKPKCDVCDRPRSVVTCVACGYRQGNLRVQMQCPTHGRVSIERILSFGFSTFWFKNYVGTEIKHSE